MTDRQEFERRLDEVIARTTLATSEQIGHPVAAPDRFVLLMKEVKGQELTRAEALDRLYLGPEASFVFIDVAIELGGEHAGAAWVRPSAHHPRAPSQVWDPDDIGPFKALGGIGLQDHWEAAKRDGIPKVARPRDIPER